MAADGGGCPFFFAAVATRRQQRHHGGSSGNEGRDDVCVRRDGEESGEGGGKWGGWKCNGTLLPSLSSLSGGNDNGGGGGRWHNGVRGVRPHRGGARGTTTMTAGVGVAAAVVPRDNTEFRGRRLGWPVNRSIDGGRGVDGAGWGRGRDPRERYVVLDDDKDYNASDPFNNVGRWGRRR